MSRRRTRAWWSRASIRVRLTAWYTTALALMLAAYAVVTFVAVRHEFHEQLAQEARQRAAGRDATVTAGERVDQQLREVLLVLVLGMPPVVACAGAGGYALARRALAPIDHLADDARRISAEHLHRRVSVPNQHDEIGRLAAVINDTFGRLEASFAQLHRFTADASHELRTPLSIIRGIGELGLGEVRSPEDYREAMASILEEVDRLTRLVDSLLRLSRGDAGTLRLVPDVFDLVDLVREVTSSLTVLAEEREQQIQMSAAGAVHVFADRLVLREALTNVVDNAVKYSPLGSTIGVAVGAQGERATVAVADRGPGIAVEHRTRIFERFYRVDEGRSRDVGGSGLGLAIAKWAVEANGGQISLDSSAEGTVFQIVLPRHDVA